jgi:hypothetical protein
MYYHATEHRRVTFFYRGIRTYIFHRLYEDRSLFVRLRFPVLRRICPYIVP